jgi:VCBS repeat-containing protein
MAASERGLAAAWRLLRKATRLSLSPRRRRRRLYTLAVDYLEVRVLPTVNCLPDFYNVMSGQTLVTSTGGPNGYYGVLQNDFDSNSYTLTASLDTGPAHGQLTLNTDGTFTYQAAAGFFGRDTFTYTASDGVDSDSAVATIWVAVPPAVTGVNVTAVEGELFNGPVATVTLPGTGIGTDLGGLSTFGIYTLVIDWGDGQTSSQVLPPILDPSSQGFVLTVNGLHTYAEESAPDHPNSDPYTITLNLYFDSLASFSTPPGILVASATTSAYVSDPSVVPTGGSSFSAVENQDSGLQPLATFTDPGGPEALDDYSATVAWGDGQSSSALIAYDETSQVYTVWGSHTYAEESDPANPSTSPYAFTVTIDHENAPPATATGSADVSDPAVLPAGSYPYIGVEGLDNGAQPLASFTDPAGPEDSANYAATIDWGDGQTSNGTITFDASTQTFTVWGSHAYLEESDPSRPAPTLIPSR